MKEEQLRDLEDLFFRAGDDRGQFARELVQLVERLGEKYQVDELAAKYDFTGRKKMTVPEALEIKEELEEIDKLLKQLEEARKNAQIGVIDLEELSKFAEPGDVEQLQRPPAADRRLPPRAWPRSRGSTATRGRGSR